MSARYAIIGSGMMGREHIRNLALIMDAELVAISDPDTGSQNWGLQEAGEPIAIYADNAEMMRAEKPDAVIIASPNFTHRHVIDDIAEYGAAMLVEKPMATTNEDALALHQFAQDYGPLFWVGLEYRYMPPVTRYVEYLHDDQVGQIRMLSIREHRFPFLPKIGDWNRFNRNTGGTLVEKCCHFFDLMRHILQDEPVRIYASGAQDVNHLNERYDGETPDISRQCLCHG